MQSNESACGKSGRIGLEQVSRFWARFIGHNTYTGPIRGNRAKFHPIQGSVLKKNKYFHDKRYSFSVIYQIFAEKIINNITIKASCDPRIVDHDILKPFRKVNYETLYVCDQYVITFGTIKVILGFFSIVHV